jgi:hypothetical protein
MLPDATKCAIPAWMLDEYACSRCVVGQQPVISRPALEALRSLLNALTLPSAKTSVTCSRGQIGSSTGATDASTGHATQTSVSM